MKFAAACFALLLSACATPAAIYRSEVDKTATTSKSLAEVSQCLQLRWALAPIVTPDGKTNFPMKNGYGQTLGMLTLTDNGTGTLIELRKTGQMVFGGGDWKKCL